jgi:hypothetical protein
MPEGNRIVQYSNNLHFKLNQMKRSFVFFFALMAGALSFSSCNKDLKDDVNELRNQLGTDEPITATTTFTDKNNVERKVVGTYKFKGVASFSNALIKHSDNTYEVRIGRFETIDSETGCYLVFTYDAANKKVLSRESGHYWEEMGSSNGEAYVYENDEPIAGLSFNVDVKSIDLEAGHINVDVKIEGSKEFALANEDQVPNKNSAFTTTFSFNGKLKKFDRE